MTLRERMLTAVARYARSGALLNYGMQDNLLDFGICTEDMVGRMISHLRPGAFLSEAACRYAVIRSPGAEWISWPRRRSARCMWTEPSYFQVAWRMPFVSLDNREYVMRRLS